MLVLIVSLMLVPEVLLVPVNLHAGNVRTQRFSSVLGRTYNNLAESIASGTKMAMEHCQNLFKWEQWNCPTSYFNKQQKLPPTKETAFAKAIVAAAIAHSITRNCSLGIIENCGCDKTDKTHIPTILKSSIPPEIIKNSNLASVNTHNTSKLEFNSKNGSNYPDIQWKWGGCSDDPTFAADYTEQLMNSLDYGLGVPDYIGRHNSKVGIKLLQSSMVRKCRCHGVSGSCTMQTCWMQMANFGEISKKLKILHRKSKRVNSNTVQKSIFMGNSATEDFVQEVDVPGTEKSLIYLEQSPDYCLPNPSQGHSGTKGRMCSRNRVNTTKVEKNSCRKLCKKCGHSIKRIKKKVPRRCNCTFTWCCDVKCDTCLEEVNDYFCQ